MILVFIGMSTCSFCQNDSLSVQFGTSNEENCIVLHSATHSYRIESQEKQQLPALKYTNFFDPGYVNDFYTPRPDIRLRPFHFEGLTLNAFIEGISDQEAFRYDDEIWVPMTRKETIEFIAKKFGDTIYPVKLEDSYRIYGLVKNTAPEEQWPKVQTTDSMEIQGGIVTGVFMAPKMTYWRKTSFQDLHPETWDSIQKSFGMMRDERYQEKVDSLLHPFYLSAYEVTNKEYREFTDWVRDSIAREYLFQHVASNKKASKMICNCSEKVDVQLSNRTEVRKKCRLNWDFQFSYTDPEYVEILAPMYFPQPERFYKRREMNVSRLSYQNANGEFIAIYPDTSQFYALNSIWSDLYAVTYFWHPAYDRYPVVNISYHQIQAFLEWKTIQINRNLKHGRLEIRLPSLYHYEIAAKYAFNFEREWEVTDRPNTSFTSRQRNVREYGSFLNRVSRPLNTSGTEASKDDELFHRWYHTRYNKYFSFLTGNVSEIVADQVTAEKLTYYEMKDAVAGPACFVLGENYSLEINGNQGDSYNSVFYKQALGVNASNSFTGFRLLYIYHEE